MKVTTNRTARFASVVSACGKPEVITLWGTPGKAFLQAVKEERVMTLKQATVGTSKDFGVVGFVQEKNVSYLLFPKPLSSFREQRIIGINYDLVDSGTGISYSSPPPVPAGKKELPAPRQPKETRPPKSAAAPEPKPLPKPAPKATAKIAFEVVFKYSLETEATTRVMAVSRKEALSIAEKTEQPPDFSRLTPRRKLVRIKPEKTRLG